MAQVRAFNQARQIGDRERHRMREITHLHHAKVRLQRRKGIIRDFGLGGREPRDQRGLAYIGVADESGVGQQAQLQAVVPLFAGAAQLMLARSLVGRGRKC